MIKLFNVPSHCINTSSFKSVLHGGVVSDFEDQIKNYVGAKYACAINSASSAIFLSLIKDAGVVKVPSIIPPVVLNSIILSGNSIEFTDNTDWVGHSYNLHTIGDYSIIDSAQKLERDQFKKEANPQDLMIFSFYPTKPVSSCDGGMVVSNDEEKINWFRTAVMNGTSPGQDSWTRTPEFPGWKMYMNSLQASIAIRNFKNLNNKYDSLLRIQGKYNNAFGLKNNSLHLYRIKVPCNITAQKDLLKLGVQCGIHYTAAHECKIYHESSESSAQSSSNAKLINSSYHSKQCLSLPFHENLNCRDVDLVIRHVKKIII